MVNGIALGMLFALMAVGLTITLGLMRVINMAHGALYTLGAYALVATYAASVRQGGKATGKPLGVLAIHFDWGPQSQAVVDNVRFSGETT